MRKVIQIATVVAEEPGQIPQVRTTALCDDGTVWAMTTVYTSEKGSWEQQTPIPQDDPEQDATQAWLRDGKLIAYLAPNHVECSYADADHDPDAPDSPGRVGIASVRGGPWKLGTWVDYPDDDSIEVLWLRRDPSKTVKGEGMAAVTGAGK